MIALQLSDEQKKIVIELIEKYFSDCTIWVFGSRIRSEKVKKFSDLDLAVMGKENISIDNLGKIKEEFSASDLPFMVDVVVFEDLPIQMQESIRKEHIVLKA